MLCGLSVLPKRRSGGRSLLALGGWSLGFGVTALGLTKLVPYFAQRNIGNWHVPIIGVLAALFFGGAICGLSLSYGSERPSLVRSLAAMLSWGLRMALGSAVFSVLAVLLGELAKPVLSWAITRDGAFVVGDGLEVLLKSKPKRRRPT